MALLGIGLFRMSSLQRAIAIVFAIFTFGLQVDVGIGVYPLRVIGIAAIPLMFFDKSLDTIRFHRLFSQPLSLLFAYLVVVGYFAYLDMPSLQGSLGGMRARQLRPVVALSTIVVLWPTLWTLFIGLRDRPSILKFLTWWTYIALASAGLAFVQEFTFLFWDQPLFGVFREEDPVAVLNISGAQIMRVSGFAGEPKHFGMCMLITIGMLVGLDDTFRGVWIHRNRWRLASVMAVALLLSFSSGTFLAAGALLVLSMLQRAAQIKWVTAGLVVVAIVAFLVFPSAISGIYEHRIKRITSKVQNSAALAAGTQSVVEASDDKEAAALAYLMQNPQSAVFGHGFGIAPYYYNHLVHPRWRHLMQDPNSGVTYVLLNMGIIGVLFVLVQFRHVFSGAFVPAKHRSLIRTMFFCNLAMWLPMHLFGWGIVFLGLAATPGWTVPKIAGDAN